MEKNKTVDVVAEKVSYGDILLVDLGNNFKNEKSGIRPCVVLSKKGINDNSDNIIVAPLTDAEHKKNDEGWMRLLPTHVHMSKSFYKFLSKNSILQLEDIRSISKHRVLKKYGSISEQTSDRINKTLFYMLLAKES